MSPIRNPQCPQSTPFLTPLPDTLLIKISIQNFRGIFLRVKKNIIYEIKDDPVLQVSRQEAPNVIKVPPFLTPPS